MSAMLKQKLIDIANGFTKYGLWKGGGSSALSDMSDVTFTNLQANDVLKYNGSVWVNGNLDNKIGNILVLYSGWDSGSMDITLPDYGLYLVTIHHNYYGDPTFIISSGNNVNISSQLIGMTNAGTSKNISISDNGDSSNNINASKNISISDNGDSGNNINVSSELVGMTNAGTSKNISISDNGDKSIRITRNWANYAIVRVWKI